MEEIPNFLAFRQQPPAILNFLEVEHGAVDAKIRHFIVKSGQKDKLATADRLLRKIGQAQSVVFVNYREAVERVGQWLISEGHSVSMFHGGLEQDDREAALGLFRSGSANVLVSTELSARGIDIPQLQNVIHYHLPSNSEAYIHRCGRTGRWNLDGDSYIILGPEEKLPDLGDIKFCDYAIEPPYPAPAKPEWVMIYVGRGKRDKISKGDIVGFLCKVGGVTVQDIGMIDVRERYTHVAVKRITCKQILQRTNGEKIKKMTTKIEPVVFKRHDRQVHKKDTVAQRFVKKT